MIDNRRDKFVVIDGPRSFDEAVKIMTSPSRQATIAWLTLVNGGIGEKVAHEGNVTFSQLSRFGDDFFLRGNITSQRNDTSHPHETRVTIQRTQADGECWIQFE